MPQRPFEIGAVQLFRAADAAAANGDEVTAESIYRTLLFDPSQEVRLEARFRLALLEVQRGNIAQAMALLRRVLAHRPDASRVRLELAGLLSKVGDNEEALRQLRAIDPRAPHFATKSGNNAALRDQLRHRFAIGHDTVRRLRA